MISLNCYFTGELALASPESVSEHLDVLFPKLIEVSAALHVKTECLSFDSSYHRTMRSIQI